MFTILLMLCSLGIAALVLLVADTSLSLKWDVLPTTLHIGWYSWNIKYPPFQNWANILCVPESFQGREQKTSSQAPRCASWKAYKLRSSQTSKLTSWQIYNWQNDKLKNWLIDWQEDKSLPPGWKVAYYTPNLGSMKVILELSFFIQHSWNLAGEAFCQVALARKQVLCQSSSGS